MVNIFYAMYSRALTALALCTALAVETVTAISKISAVGSKFFTDDGNQFYIKGELSHHSCYHDTAIDLLSGVAYQLTSHDPLIDTNQCKMDASLMKDLGANTIRVYHVDPNADHKGCMSAFSDNGIYLFVDLDTFATQITQVLPWTGLGYKTSLLIVTRTCQCGIKHNSVRSRRSWTNFRSMTIPLGCLSEMRFSLSVCDRPTITGPICFLTWQPSQWF